MLLLNYVIIIALINNVRLPTSHWEIMSSSQNKIVRPDKMQENIANIILFIFSYNFSKNLSVHSMVVAFSPKVYTGHAKNTSRFGVLYYIT